MNRVRHALFLAGSSLGAHPWQSLVVVLGLAVAIFLPGFTWRVGQVAEDALLARARSTPIVVGPVGSEVDLVLASLYFRGEVDRTVSMALANELAANHDAAVVPMLLGFSAGGAPVLGTTLDYLDARGLSVAEGRPPGVLGEVVVGSAAAQALGLSVGDALRSDARDLYNLAGTYPVLLQVVGVLAPTGTPDDDAVITDLKTAWTLSGLLHGHGEVDEANIVGGDAEAVEASLAMFLFTEVTPASLPTFHLHGTPETWPLTAILVFPADRRVHDQVLGDLATESLVQAVRPEGVVRTLLDIVLQIQALLAGWVVLVATSTVAFLGLVVSLVLRLRAEEIRLMRRLGAGRAQLALILGAEAALCLLGAAALAGAGVALTEPLLRAWLG